jgi:hypothetical protein
MDCSFFSSRFAFLSLLVLTVFLLLSPLTNAYAKAGCCSRHGGVAGCNAQGKQTCKDSTISPTCTCAGYTGTKAKSTKSTVTTTTGSIGAAAATAVTTIKNKITGCCSRHGGVAGCNAQGYQTCKDGTTSPNCKCTPTKTKVKKSSVTTTTGAAAGAAATTTVTPSKTKTAGCCSRHGGIARCDKAAGFQLCKDGTRSNCPCK